jgi:anhydro-N-acetylmuramic acid kinase
MANDGHQEDSRVTAPMRVLGLMSGTSLDAIDVALCEIQPDPVVERGLLLRLLGHWERPHPLRGEVLSLLGANKARLDDLTELNFGLGGMFAAAASSVLQELEASHVDLIASHGQTIFHLVREGRPRATLQLGEPAVIAERTGVTVAADFRVADMAAGGQGAPLVSFFDALFFADAARGRAVQNIGGIANVTFVPPSGVDGAYAFDTGPGNVLIDYGARHFSGGAERYDRDGAMAARGQVNAALLEELLTHPYFSKPPPKTTGREIFGDHFGASLVARAGEMALPAEDVMATLTALTAESIARAYRGFGPPAVDDVVMSGGGARNGTLMGMLRRRLPGVRFHQHDDFGVPADAKEAVAFALLGYEALHGRPANLPRCTGARHPVILGKIVPGKNYRELLRRVAEEGGISSSLSRTLRLLP